jgi:hypothetical protein
MFSSVSSLLGFSPSKSAKTPTEAPSPGSTVAGSSPADGDGQTPNTMPEYKGGSSGLPDYEYPTIFVKNTFIDGPGGPPESLVDFMEPRQAQSCPTSALIAPPGLFDKQPDTIPEDLTAAIEANSAKTAALDTEPTQCVKPMQWPRTMSGDQLDSLASVAMNETPEKASPVKEESVAGSTPLYTATPSPSPVRPMMFPRTMSGDALEMYLAQESSPNDGMLDPSLVSAALPPPPTEWAPTLMQEATLPPPMGYPINDYPQQAADDGLLAAPVLRLAEVIPEPELGSPEYPTRGSKAHRQGGCKPCAFLHTKGCQNGVECEFCHLCEPGEKKKRQREKRHMQRMGVNPLR